GLASGIIKGLRESGSATKVYAVEPAIANDFSRSFTAGTVIVNESEPQTIADGVRTLSVGKNNWQYLKDGVEAVLEVSEQTIQDSMRMVFQLANVKCEPTGAVALAGAISNKPLFTGKRICCIVSGGNVDPEVFHRLVCA